MNQLLQAPLPSGISERLACHVLDICRNTFRAIRARYHFCGPVSPHRRKRKDTQQPRALSVEERTQAKAVLSSTEYQDQPPAQVYYRFRSQDERFDEQKEKYGHRHEEHRKSECHKQISASEFDYDPVKQACICPQGNELTFNGLR